jgi:transposase
VSPKTLNRLAVLLAARRPDAVVKLEELDDTLAAELARRIRQARAAGWSDETLADVVEQALSSERHRTAAQRRNAFCEHLDRLAAHVRAFARILTTLAGDQLNTWLHAVQNDIGQPQLMSFVRGVLADYDAVRAGLTLRHSSGPVEGNGTRIKMIKRKLYGRANFDLLRSLVVLGP